MAGLLTRKRARDVPKSGLRCDRKEGFKSTAGETHKTRVSCNIILAGKAMGELHWFIEFNGLVFGWPSVIVVSSA